jgi:8-oxo-dGTP pyrophosphatase MutT (NUDIX family)
VRVLLVQQTNGVIGFPKGHVETRADGQRESLYDAAARELFEETKLRVCEWLDAPREGVVYEYDFVSFSKSADVPYGSFAHHARRDGIRVHKTVHLYPALVSGVTQLHAPEIAHAWWCSLENAEAALVAHPELLPPLAFAARSARRRTARRAFLSRALPVTPHDAKSADAHAVTPPQLSPLACTAGYERFERLNV